MVEGSGASITVKVIKAESVRQHLGKKPDVAVHLRVNVGGNPQSLHQSLQKSTAISNTISPQWDQTFVLPVENPKASQLECSLWDESDEQPSAEKANFLGEVILNLAKLVPYSGKYIEQVFDIKQGKTPVVGDNKASGKLKLGLTLKLDGDEAPAPAPAQATREVPPPAQATRAAAPPPAQATRAAAPPAPAAPAGDSEQVKPSQLRTRPAPEPLPEPQPGYLPKVGPSPTMGTLVVSVQGGSNLPKSETGQSPDPYVVLSLEGTSKQAIVARTATVRRTEHPDFRENDILFPVDEAAMDAAEFNVSVFNWNRGQDELIGVTSVKVKDVTNGAIDTQFELRNPKKNYQPVHSTQTNLPSKLGLALSYRPPENQRGAPAGPPARVPPAPTAVAPSPGADENAPRVLQKRPMAQSPPLPSGKGPADVGIVLGPGPGNAVVVQQLLPGGPGANVGTIRSGDAIIDVDGHDVVGRGVDEISGMLYGERNSPVTMIFRRGNLSVPGGEQIVVTLLRAVPGGGPQRRAAATPEDPHRLQAAAPNARHAAPPPREDRVDTQYVEEMAQLKRDFSAMSFLWGEPVPDPLLESMKDWKTNILYGPKSEHPQPELPMPSNNSQVWTPMAGMPMEMPMDDPRFGLRRSFNQFPPPMTSQMNPPMYRSFDGGALNAGVVRPLTYMRASSGDFPNARFSPGDAQMYRPMESSMLDGSRMLDGSMLRLARPEFQGRPAESFQPMHSSSRFASGTPLQSYAAPVSRPMTSFGPSSMPMAPVDKNEMVC